MEQEADLRPAPSTYAIGDLHGEVSLLRRLLLILPYREQDTLVFLGDYMDRGEDSVALMRELLQLTREHERTILLRGNHDSEWLEMWNGVRFQEPPGIDGSQEVWDACEGRVPFEVGYVLEGTRIEYEDEYAYYAHAGLAPGMSFERTPPIIKLWGARDFLESAYDWGKPVVFGHWQLRQPWLERNKIGVDTGAYHTGVLTAVRLPDCAIFQARR
jgi:serine/threonine protein phosphatase 1